MNKAHIPWIEQGYQVFAYEGPKGLKIERLAKGVGKNKSSFYHHFTDKDLFVDALLEYHLENAQILAEKETQCTSLAELIEVIVEHKMDLLFNRQLRIHRANKDFEKCFIKTNQLTSQAVIRLWAGILGLEDNSYLAELVLKLSLENFYLQITDETLNPEWLNNYFIELRSLIRGLRESKKINSLDDTV